MPKVALLDPRHVVPSIPGDSRDLRSWRQLEADAVVCRDPTFQLVRDFESADVIIAPTTQAAYGYRFVKLHHSEFFHRHGFKSVIYSADDLFHLPAPGLYPACTPWAERTGWAMPAHYRMDHLPQWNFTPEELERPRDLLFSFVGSVCNHPVRARIMRLAAPDVFLHDSSPGKDQWWNRSLEDQQVFKDQFRAQILRSQFALCPRGVIDASIRLFESMEAGATPVIIADTLCLPQGPDWETFSLRVPESDVEKLPDLLRAHRADARRMGRLAREAWEQFFSPETSFATVAGWAMTLLERSRAGYPWHVRAWARACSFFKTRTLRSELASLRGNARA